MKIRLRTIFLIITFLVLGLVIGSRNTIGPNNYFEESKNEFEDTIQTPNNKYQPPQTKIEGNILSKAAIKIDEKINSLIQAVLDKIA